MTPVGWIAASLATWAGVALVTITALNRATRHAAPHPDEQPIDPWDYELRTLLDETLG